MMKYILIAGIFISCNVSQRKPVSFSTEVLDTILTTPPAVTAQPLLFENAFVKGTREKLNDSTLYLYGITVGNIKVTSGRMVACDPLHIDEYGIPFTQVFPVGEFPVQFAIGKLGVEECIAFARIKFSDEPVVKWELALQAGQEPLPVGSEDIHGFGVDAGMGIFIDQQAIKSLNLDSLASMTAALYTEMDQHRHNDWRYAIYHFGNYNLAGFTTGFGDGRYATYIGFDAAGKPCRLLSDFNIFNWKKKQ